MDVPESERNSTQKLAYRRFVKHPLIKETRLRIARLDASCTKRTLPSATRLSKFQWLGTTEVRGRENPFASTNSLYHSKNFGEFYMRRFIAIALVAVASVGVSATTASAGFGLLHRGAGCCDTAPACDAAPSCGCEVAAPSCGCEAPAPSCCARPHLLKSFFGKLHSKIHARGCCEPAPSCGCEAPVVECAAPAPVCCDVAPAAPSCGCEVAVPSCGCEEPAPCCKPHGHKIKALFSKIKCHMKSKCQPVCCEAPAPSCGCEAPVAAPSCGCGA